ncbi:AAA domain-containing protein [Anaerovirgula multivorans]|uniref:AAA domain-containing protein n=1 Tax=Anaerovirgula multivorans TaxID=312168 RepID=A0A239LDQ3_9FIRM|nr:ATP-binding protein [Anaerovirgula multivorans]SNT27769.1 AAA domain-containing protein [Anaerovirgula multivorans]
MLRNLLIKDFGPFSDFRMTFKKGANVIVGANGSGKTQLIGSIAYAYYGKSVLRTIPISKSITHSGEVVLFFDVKQGNVIIKRSFDSKRDHAISINAEYKSVQPLLQLDILEIAKYCPLVLFEGQNIDFGIDIDAIEKKITDVKLSNKTETFLRNILKKVRIEENLDLYRVHSAGERYLLNVLGIITFMLNFEYRLLILDGFTGMIGSHIGGMLLEFINSYKENIQVILTTTVEIKNLHNDEVHFIENQNHGYVEGRMSFDYCQMNLLSHIESKRTDISSSNNIVQYVKGAIVELEENIEMEFKEVKGNNSTDSILSLVDQYVVAFLNSKLQTVGRILWGITDKRIVKGVTLQYEEKDKLRREISNKLLNISPPIAQSSYSLNLVEVYDSTMNVLKNLYVVEITVFPSKTDFLYATSKEEVFIKTDGGKKKLKIQELQVEIISRKLEREQNGV